MCMEIVPEMNNHSYRKQCSYFIVGGNSWLCAAPNDGVPLSIPQWQYWF